MSYLLTGFCNLYINFSLFTLLSSFEDVHSGYAVLPTYCYLKLNLNFEVFKSKFDKDDTWQLIIIIFM